MVTPKADAVVLGAIDLAAEAATSIAEPGTVGEHVGARMDGERLATHFFACLAPGYPDWRWAITVARAPRAKVVTVCETNLLPSEGSVLAPAWLPYEERIRPGDLGATDVLPYVEDDPNLEPGFEATGDEDVDRIAVWELGLGRPRVLSMHGRGTAAQRWYDGASGPDVEVAKASQAHCRTCGYFMPLAGALRQVFGVCAHEWSPSDGRVVSLDHGCGAHSEVDVRRDSSTPPPPVHDDLALDVEHGADESPAEAPVDGDAAGAGDVDAVPAADPVAGVEGDAVAADDTDAVVAEAEPSEAPAQGEVVAEVNEPEQAQV